MYTLTLLFQYISVLHNHTKTHALIFYLNLVLIILKKNVRNF